MGKWESGYGTAQHPGLAAEVTHSETEKKEGGKGKKKQIPHVLSKALKMLGQLTGQVGVFNSVLEIYFKDGKFCRNASLCF